MDEARWSAQVSGQPLLGGSIYVEDGVPAYIGRDGVRIEAEQLRLARVALLLPTRNELTVEQRQRLEAVIGSLVRAEVSFDRVTRITWN